MVEGRSDQREHSVLRVLQVFSALGVGGAETWLLSLLKYFREDQGDLGAKVQFDILLTGGAKAVFDDEAVSLGARLFYLSFTRRNILGFTREFRRILAQGNYDVIHDHQDYIAGLHFLLGLGRLPRVRIAHVHNPVYHRSNYARGPTRQLVKSGGKRLLSWLATDVAGTSRQILGEYGFDNSKRNRFAVDAVYCGVEAEKAGGNYATIHLQLCREFGWPESVRIVLFVGRLESDEVVHAGKIMTHKNPAFALEIARACIAQDERVRFLMVGAGEATKLKDRVGGWGLNGQVRFLGVRSDVSRLMLGSDLLLFPSLAEGLGMVVVEAQAAGLRVLASDTTPQECVVIPDLVSFLPLTAESQQWAKKTLSLMNLQRVSATECIATVKASPFSIENSAARLLSIYLGSRAPN